MERLKNTPDGDGSLLDHSMILYGSSISDGNRHTHTDLPLALIGGGSGTLKGDRHIGPFPARRNFSQPVAQILIRQKSGQGQQ